MQNCVGNIQIAANMNSANPKLLDLVLEVQDMESLNEIKAQKYKIKKDKNNANLIFELGSLYHGRKEWKKKARKTLNFLIN